MALTVSMTSVPLRSDDDRTLRKYKEQMDKFIYDTGVSTLPLSTSGVTLTVSGATSGNTTTVYHNSEVYMTRSGQTTFSFTLVPVAGFNNIQVVNGVENAEVAFVADLVYAVVAPMTEVLRTYADKTYEAWANGYLKNGGTVPDNYGGYQSPSPNAISETWGDWLNVSRISGYTVDQYITLLRTALGIYQQGAVTKSIDDSGYALAADDSQAIPRGYAWHYPGSVAVPFMQCSRTAPTADTTTVIVNAGKVRIQNRLYNVQYAEVNVRTAATLFYLVVSTGVTWAYLNPGGAPVSSPDIQLDGTFRTGDTIFNSAEITTPTMQYSQTIRTIQTDTDGSITGIVGGKYVILEQIPTSIDEIISYDGYNNLFYDLLGSSRIVQDSDLRSTAIVDLGTRLDATVFDPAGSGVTVSYTAANRGVFPLARIDIELYAPGGIMKDISEITTTISPGHGAWNVSRYNAAHDFDLFVKRITPFTAEEIAWMLTFIPNVIPMQGKGYLLLSNQGTDPSPDVYHLYGYGYNGVIE